MKNEEKECNEGLKKHFGVKSARIIGLSCEDQERFLIRTLFLQNNEVYHGACANNRPNGIGKLIYSAEKLYKGEFLNGNFEGLGIYRDLEYVYEGGWKNNKREGLGREELKSLKQVYKGQFVNDLRHGKGKLIDNGIQISGIFNNGMLKIGKWKNQNFSFKGKWENGKLKQFLVFECKKKKFRVSIYKGGKVKIKFIDGKQFTLLQSLENSSKFMRLK